MAKGKVTIKMVAERAGVSRGTVDRVINQRPHVKKEQYDKVVAAIRELGYEPIHKRQAEAVGLETSSMESRKFGVILPRRNEDYTREIRRGIRDAMMQLADYAVEIIVEESGTDLPDETLRHMDELLQKGVCGMVLCALDHVSVAEKINELAEKGIPVITFENDISHCRRLCFFGQNLQRAGRVAGGLMAAYIRKDQKVLEAVGTMELPLHRTRAQNFRKCLLERGFREEQIIMIETFNDYTITFGKVKKALEEHPDIGGIYMANHSLTGCVDAVHAAGRGHEVHIITHDLMPSVRKYLKTGDVDFTVTPNVYLQGYRPLILLYDYIGRGIRPEAEQIHSSTEIIGSENIDIKG